MDNENSLPCADSDIVEEWKKKFNQALEAVFIAELEETRKAVANEELWELGCIGEEFNPHTENLRNLRLYRKWLIASLESVRVVMPI